MQNYWFAAMHSGKKFGLMTAQTIIRSKMRALKASDLKASAKNERIAELNYLFHEIERVLNDVK
jgi:hypothetical protein